MSATRNHPTTTASLETVFEVQTLLRGIVAGLDRADAEQPEIDAVRVARMAVARLDAVAASIEAALESGENIVRLRRAA